jgi:hypothetical protein
VLEERTWARYGCGQEPTSRGRLLASLLLALLAGGVVLVGLPAAMVTLSIMTHTLAAAPARRASHLRPAAALRSE